MRITTVRGWALRASMPAPVRNSRGVIAERTALLVEVVADDELSGWGETQEDVATAWDALLRDGLADAVLGADPDDPALPDRLPSPADRDAARARSALDLALWDLRARVAGVPLVELLGGARRDAVPAYASAPFQALGDDPYRDLDRDAAALRAEGFRAMKLRAGVAPEADVAAVARMRAATGGAELMIDVNGGYDRERAAALVDAAADSGLRWIEEPVESDDVEGMAMLRRRSAVPIAGGETLWRRKDAERLLRAGGVDVIQPDLYLCGGITGMRELAALAAEHGVPLVPHAFGSGVNLRASLHVAASLPAAGDLPLLEFDRSANPLRSIPPEPALDADGAVPLPGGIGIGPSPVPADLDRFLVGSWALPAMERLR
jgi:D-galactarolactone cycloisomerase